MNKSSKHANTLITAGLLTLSVMGFGLFAESQMDEQQTTGCIDIIESEQLSFLCEKLPSFAFLASEHCDEPGEAPQEFVSVEPARS